MVRNTHLRACFAHRQTHSIYAPHVIWLLLVVHLLLGFRRLRDRDYYQEDPLIRRVLGLTQLPDVATISRSLADADARSVEGTRRLVRTLVLERLERENLREVTLDFDGSVLSTKAHAEGSALGYNPRRKGQRSYYPLFCTVAQTQQFFDFLHRSGNVPDSNGALPFRLECREQVRTALPRALQGARLDGAFFDTRIIDALDQARVGFTASVPFARLADLKRFIQERRRWCTFDPEWAYFERRWKPKSWGRAYRFLFVRQLVAERRRGPLQLDLFEPVEPQAKYTVIVTNRRGAARKILAFHHGRGSQESLFGEAKSDASLDTIPVRTLHGNPLYTLASMLAHNLGKEIQIAAEPKRPETDTRSSPWLLRSLRTLRNRFLLRAGRITRPKNRSTLTLNGNPVVKEEFLQLLSAQMI